MSSPVSTTVIDGVANVTLSRSPVNALDTDMVERLDGAIALAEADAAVKVMVIRSSEQAFCAGADIKMMTRLLEDDDGAELVAAFSSRLQQTLRRLADAPFITVAVVAGAALGGGLELAMACDIRVAAVGTKLGMPEANIGLLPGAGGTQRLSEIAGRSFAIRAIATGSPFSAEEGYERGVITEVAGISDIESRVAELVALLVQRERLALELIKRCVRASGTDSGFVAETDATRLLAGQPVALERMREFIDSRRLGATR